MGSGGVFGGSWGVFGRSRGVFGGWVRRVFFIGVFGFSFVFDISDETVVVISGVGHNLDTAVGKVNSVRSSEVATGILVFVLFETGTRVIIMDTVLVSERLRGEFFNWVGFVWCWWWGMVWGGGWVVWRWGSIGTGGSYGHEGGENDGLK
jgi:hypothetical protein